MEKRGHRVEKRREIQEIEGYIEQRDMREKTENRMRF